MNYLKNVCVTNNLKNYDNHSRNKPSYMFYSNFLNGLCFTNSLKIQLINLNMETISNFFVSFL